MEWRVEEMKLMSQELQWGSNSERKYREEALPREEKIAFLDSRYDGKVSQMLELVAKFKVEKEELPKDIYGGVKKVSLKAWLRRNDKNQLTSDSVVGEFKIGSRNIARFNTHGSYARYSDAIEQLFYQELKNLVKEEHKYFLSVDSYSVLKTRLREKIERNNFFNLNLAVSTDGEIFVMGAGRLEEKRSITSEEILYILRKYEELEKYISGLNVELKY